MSPQDSSSRDRREFLKDISMITAGLALPGMLGGAEATEPGASAAAAESGPIPKRQLGKTGVQLSILGVGGHAFALASTEEESIRIVHQAIDAGVNLMDNAWEYNNGRSETVMGKALKGKRDKVFLMTKDCSHGKGKDVALRHLEESLRRLQTDHLDLWMIHEVNTLQEVEAAFAPGGAIEALEQAKKEGKTRYIGFTGHQDPKVHLAMLAKKYPFDAVLMPINAFEQHRTGFRTQVLPELRRQEIGVLAMKSLGGVPARILRDGRITAEKAIRFTLSHPITTLISGMRSIENLEANVKIARTFTPMAPAEMEALTTQMASLNIDNRYTHYRHPSYRDGHGLVA
ncbi:MAG TPA: aldo/keto reductase [Verrucomicrobiota bacterium]|nr:aldo/keto reductase [Verrucomicrobiota bacterium]